MTREEAVEVAHQAGRANLAAHIGQLHDELDELHAKHGSTRAVHVPTPTPASWGHADGEQRGLSADEAKKEAVAKEEVVAEAAPAVIIPSTPVDYDPALDDPLPAADLPKPAEVYQRIADTVKGVFRREEKAADDAPEEEATAPEGEPLGSSTKPDHPDSPKKSKKGGR